MEASAEVREFESLICPECGWIHDPDDDEACMTLRGPDDERLAEDVYDPYMEEVSP